MEMADRSPTGRTRSGLALFLLLWLVGVSFAFSPLEKAAAQTQLPGYVQAEDAFMRLTMSESNCKSF